MTKNHQYIIDFNNVQDGSDAPVQAQSAPVLSVETDDWRCTGIEGVECTKDGRFRAKNGRLIKTFVHRNRWCMNIKDSRRNIFREHCCRSLIARAWCDDYYDGCGIKYLDGDPLNIHLENMECCTMTEYMRWRAKIAYQKKSEIIISQHGEFKESGVDGICIAKDGYCIRNGILYKPRNNKSRANGNPMTVSVAISVNNVRRYYNVSDLMARAWLKRYYFDGCHVTYRDYNIHNVHPDNIRLVDDKQYFSYLSRNNVERTNTIYQQRERMQQIIRESEMCLRFLQDGDYSIINKYINDEIIPKLYRWCVNAMSMSSSRASHCVTIGIEHIYMVLDTNHGCYDMLHLAQKAIKRVQTHGDLSRQPLPSHISKEIDNTNLQELCRKFSQTKLSK